MWTSDETNHLALSLKRLLEQIDSISKTRDKSWDGSIGDARHQTTKSEHNPDANGVVRAMDITHDPGAFDAYAFAEYLRTHPDPRLQYIISNGKIANADSIGGAAPWAWRPYHGSNLHDHHTHLTVKSGTPLADDPKDWDLSGFSQNINASTKPITLRRVHKGDSGWEVKAIQEKLGLPTTDIWGDRTGEFGSETEAALTRFQEKNGLTVDGWAGPATYSKLGIFVDALMTPGTKGSQEDIIATRFGGRSDPNNSAYDNHFLTDNEPGASLPFRFVGERPLIWAIGPSHKLIENIPIVDVGPIYPNDKRGPANPYWETGSRPRAETDKVLSQAGIDFLPQTADLLGITETMGKAKVDWGFMKERSTTVPVEQQGENTPSQNEPGGQKPPETTVVTTTTTSPGASVDLSGLGGVLLAGAPLLLSWLQAKQEGKKPVLDQEAIGKVISMGLPIILTLMKGSGPAGSIIGTILPTLLGGITAVAKSEPAMSGLDKLLGGEATKGKKTATGVVTLLAAIGAQLTGVMDPVTSGGTVSVLSTLIPLGLTILGALAKIDRK